MRAICIKQPWASMIANGQKFIETRSWKTNYRGELLVVASQKPLIDNLPTGQALCIVNIIDCHPMKKEDEKFAKVEYNSQKYSWILFNIKKIKPFPVKGKLNFFQVNLP